MSVMPMAGFAIAPPTEQMRELANVDEDGGRKMSLGGAHPGIRQRLWGLAARTDPSVTFEEYRYWAKVEREMEHEENKIRQARMKSIGFFGRFKEYFSNSPYEDTPQTIDNSSSGDDMPYDEKTKRVTTKDSGELHALAPSETHAYDAEWRRAARALRTAGWGTAFWLITTDILGWGATPFVFSSLGYGEGVGLMIIFGIAAGCAGLFLWRTFLGLDSSRFPMLSFGDPFMRLYGPKTRHFINIGQALQQFMTVAVIILGNGQIVAQLAKGSICFVVCLIIPFVFGVASGFMRSLKHLGWVCNFSVWLNVISFIIIMIAAPISGPDPTFVIGSTILPKIWVAPGHTPPPPKTFAGVPPAEYQQASHNSFAAQFNGVDNMVYSFSGALLFIAFMAEMRHPMDFWKGMWLAQLFITVVYILFGVYVYSFYGQYSYSTITQVVHPYAVQVVSNVLALVTALFAVFLYFNIGFKTVYLEVGQEILGLPPITTKKGKFLWYTLGPAYWVVAFIVAASIPKFQALVSVVGGVLALNFTYSLPAIMYAAYKIQSGAELPGEGFDPYTGVVTRHDQGFGRWWRGFKRTWYVSTPTIIFALGGLACSGLGSWAAIEGMIAAFGPGGVIQTSWSCAQPS